MIPVLSIVFMGVSAIISIGLPIALYVALKRKYGLKVVPMLVGAAAFIVFAMSYKRQAVAVSRSDFAARRN